MKKLLLVLLVTCFISTAWAGGVNFEEKIKRIEFSAEISTEDLTADELLKILSEKSGITMIAVPEAGSMKVSLHSKAGQTLEEVLNLLRDTYQLAYRVNDKQNGIVIYKDQYYTNRYMTPAPALMYK